jgi:hypothetical protein
MRNLCLLALTAVSLLGADATGKWTGNLIVGSDGGERTMPAQLVLKQEGTKLTGTAGPNDGEQHPIEKGKVEDGTLTFEVPTGETVMKFSLKQDGDSIKGTITREREGQTQTAKLEVKRSQ